MQRSIFVAILTVFCLSTIFAECIADESDYSEYNNDEESSSQISDDGLRYIFLCPRTLKSGTSNKLYLRRFGELEAGYLKVLASYKQQYNSPNETIAAEKKFKIEAGQNYVPITLFVDKIDNYVYNGRIQINGSFGDKTISGSDSVSFSTPKTSVVIIQTDKPLYQPGQTVHFRVLKMNKHLKPSSKNYTVDVSVEDTKGTRLFQYNDVDVSQGIVQYEFPLSDEPVLGTWYIKVVTKDSSETTSIPFEVKRYVLPKFEVKIKFPPYVLANAEVIPIEICATYTYGKPVQGTLYLNSSLEPYYWYYDSSTQNKYPTLQEEIKINGCYKYKLKVSKIEPGDIYNYRRIMVVASVVEEGTGVSRNVTEYLQRQTSPLTLSFPEGSDYYKPELPYNGKLQVSNPDNTRAVNEFIELCATIFKKRVLAEWWATKTTQICRNFTSDENGIISFIIPPQNTDVNSMNIQAKSLRYVREPGNTNDRKHILSQPQTTKYLNAYYSPSGSFIQLQPVKQPLSCGSKVPIRLLFTSNESADFKFYYQVISQSVVIHESTIKKSFSENDDISNEFQDNDQVINGKVKQIDPSPEQLPKTKEKCAAAVKSQEVPYIGEVRIPLSVPESLTTTIHLIVYYVREDGEVVADSSQYNVEKCFANKVEFAFGDETQQPGLDTEIQINASPNSLCGIKAVDKSVTLLDNSDQLTADTVFQLVASFDTNQYYPNNPCYNNKIQPGLSNAAFKSIIRPPWIGSSSYEDSLTAFQTSGYLVISDLYVVTRPCTTASPVNRGFSRHSKVAFKSTAFAADANMEMARPQAQAGAVSSTVSVSAVRDYFPETWLFNLETVGPDGKFVDHKKLPDTITEWIGSAVCINSEDGFGISNKTSITAFQPFFIDYTLPISVIRGEKFIVIVSIFNYVAAALPVTVTLVDPEGFELSGQSINGDVCIKPNSNVNIPIILTATKVGNVNITVKAETSQSKVDCGNVPVSDAYARDAITKPIEVQAEGFPNERVINTLFCPADEEGNTFSTTIPLTVPEDLVPDSQRAYMDFTGNVMGPAIKNIDGLVSLPTGCGEQNMVKFTPIIFILEYLEDIGQLTEELKTKAINYLNIGYQRELTYRHDDGSFSAFGNTDKEGSMFLTGFVVRSFFQAKKYIAIDDNIVNTAQNWIVSKQDQDGCFPNYGQIIDIGLQGGLQNDKAKGSITAYILASLLISDFDNSTVIESAFKCLEKNSPSNPYSENLYAYACILGGRTDDAQKYLDHARQRSNKTDGMEYFIIENGTQAIEIETTAYASLTTLASGGTAQDCLPYIRYLTTHLNPYGGFQATQDTCVGLDALSQFAKLIYKDELNLKVKTTGGLETTVDITDENKLLVQRFKVSSVPSNVDVMATGTGCGLIQSDIRFNTKTPPSKKMFTLQVNGKCLDKTCSTAALTVLTSYVPSGERSGMSIVEVKLITGFVAVRESLDSLKGKNNILQIDVKNNNVIFYLSEVSNKVLDFSFEVQQVVEVLNCQPGTAKVYDYYANENSATTSYKIDGLNFESNLIEN